MAVREEVQEKGSFVGKHQKPFGDFMSAKHRVATKELGGPCLGLTAATNLVRAGLSS